MSNVIIEVNQLTKKFKSTLAVRQADFKIYKGEIFGLIGQNGAGKSTLLKMIGGLVYPSTGKIHLFNSEMNANHPYYERMGLLIENAGLYPQYSAYDNLKFVAMSYGLKDHLKHINELLELVGLSRTNKTKVKNYSMGMKQRLGIAIALMGSPDVLILDEPINGLDPQGISDIRNLILDLNSKGITIIISSHILEELSKVATKYAIIHKGEIIEIHSKEELLLKCEDRIEVEVSDVKMATPILEEHLNIGNYKVMNDHTVCIYDSHIENYRIVNALVENGISVHSIMKHKQSLEQYFLERTESVVTAHG
ncbi:ABC transporter ATP-binding protein [Ornithinibacillus halophilus]|uniref:ABC-2 type transport system ATP-binding protein n=1 Tax=Ornithinibacillus halophilus TaxID=930117 RepID=A0A1M5KWC8_9BACI|nr:ATP-binding cassette domain-containing protein [Ornithinibacillus halophilus]SHG57114.1 ABC-2 type transport system ATP-binding protein [Ornithinibacillus halophilus]